MLEAFFSWLIGWLMGLNTAAWLTVVLSVISAPFIWLWGYLRGAKANPKTKAALDALGDAISDSGKSVFLYKLVRVSGKALGNILTAFADGTRTAAKTLFKKK